MLPMARVAPASPSNMLGVFVGVAPYTMSMMGLSMAGARFAQPEVCTRSNARSRIGAILRYAGSDFGQFDL